MDPPFRERGLRKKNHYDCDSQVKIDPVSGFVEHTSERSTINGGVACDFALIQFEISSI